MIKHLFFVFLAAALVFNADAASRRRMRAAASDSLQILFVGNSYTFYNDLPAMVSKLAASQGVKLAPSRALKGGESLKGHLNHPFLPKILKQGGFDYVVIQDASYRPSYSVKYVVDSVYPYAAAIDSLAKAGSPGVKTVYYMTWGHKDGILHHKTDYPFNRTYHDMQERLKLSYLEMAYENGGLCAPVGIAWETVVNERPDIELYSLKDRHHPSKAGSYLAACVIAGTVLGKPVRSTCYFGLQPDVALFLQDIAAKVVLKYIPPVERTQ